MKSERRHHYERLKKKRSVYWGGRDNEERRNNPVAQGKKVSAPACMGKCDCCCNQRKVEGETRQEKKHALQLKEYAAING